MITYKELIDNGFVEDGRDCFIKNGFDIVCHCGVRRWNDNCSGYSEEFKTIEELNEAYTKWATNLINKYEERLKILKESLNI